MMYSSAEELFIKDNIKLCQEHSMKVKENKLEFPLRKTLDKEL